jgi:hypothetical protein
MAYFLDHLIRLLIVAGYTEQTSRENFVEAFGDRLSAIGKLAAQLNKVLGEDITSGDLELISVCPNTIFEPATMDDAYHADDRFGEGKNLADKRVASTSDVGLQRMTRGFREGKWEYETIIALKPKVVLYSALVQGEC